MTPMKRVSDSAMRSGVAWALLALAATSAGAAGASASPAPGIGKATGGPYEIERFTFDGGGGTAAGGAFQTEGALGRPDAGTALSGAGFEVVGGFFVGDGAPPPSGDVVFGNGFE
jgi:hypothetical protein